MLNWMPIWFSMLNFDSQFWVSQVHFEESLHYYLIFVVFSWRAYFFISISWRYYWQLPLLTFSNNWHHLSFYIFTTFLSGKRSNGTTIHPCSFFWVTPVEVIGSLTKDAHRRGWSVTLTWARNISRNILLLVWLSFMVIFPFWVGVYSLALMLRISYFYWWV